MPSVLINSVIGEAQKPDSDKRTSRDLAFTTVFLLESSHLAPRTNDWIPSVEAKRRFTRSESDEETRARYKAAWRKYRRLRIAFPLLVLGWLPFGYVVSAVFRFFHWNVDFLMIALLAWIPFIPIVGWQWSFWRCPRCGYAFKAIYRSLFP